MAGRLRNTLMVMKGLLQTDATIPRVSRRWQLFRRFTWELPTTLLGLASAVAVTLTTKTEVRFFHGSTFVKLSKPAGSDHYHAATLGSFILGSPHSDPLLPHEFGHTLQSRLWGPGYLPFIALPSLLSIIFSSKKHNERWFERDADMRSKMYMSRHKSS